MYYRVAVDFAAELTTEFEQLFQKILEEKNIELVHDEEHNFKGLEKSGIVLRNSSSIKISFSRSVLYSLACSFLKVKETLVEVNSLDDIANFATHVLQEVKDVGFMRGLAAFETSLKAELIIDVQASGLDFTAEIKTLTKSRENLHELVTPICKAIPQLHVSTMCAIECYAAVWSSLSGEGVTQYVASTVIEFAKVHGSDSIECYKKLNSKPTGLLAVILAGYIDERGSQFWPTVKGLTAEGYGNEVLRTLASISSDTLTTIGINDTLSFIKGSETPVDDHWLLIDVFVQIIKSPNSANSEVDSAISHSLELFKLGSEKTQRETIFQLRQIKGQYAFKRAIVNNINLEFPGIFNIINSWFYQEDVEMMFDAIGIIAIRMKSRLDVHGLRHPIQTAFQRDPNKFRDEVTKFLAHDVGVIRFVGCRIVQELDINASVFELDDTVLNLPDETQQRIIDSLMLDYTHAKSLIKRLWIFRKSKSKAALQKLVNSLADLIDNNLNEVVLTVDSLVDVDLKVDLDAKKIVHDYYDKLKAIIEAKHKIDEFKPHLNQAKLYNFYDRRFRDNMTEQINVNKSSESSLFGMMKHVLIARGHHWKMTDDPSRPPAKLAHIESKISFPRTYHINPDSFDWNTRVLISLNYNANV